MHRLRYLFRGSQRHTSKHTRNQRTRQCLVSTRVSAFSTSQPFSQVPSQARVVICGGGILGSSVAYHLAERGWSDVVLLEQGKLTCGTTWHAAGLIGTAKSSRTELAIVNYSRQLYQRLEEEGHGLGWKECGSVNVAQTKDRMVELKRKHAVSKSMGIETHIISPKEAKNLCPIIHSDDLVGAMWLPHDGVVTAPDVCMALAKIAKDKGVKIVEGVELLAVNSEKNKVSAVHTSMGSIKCEYFVNCAGQWARSVGKKAKPKPVKAPLHSCEHYFLVTKPQAGIDPMLPVLRDYDSETYFREWSGGIYTGGFEVNPKPCFHKDIPEKFEFQLLQEDWDQFQPLLDNIIKRIPMLGDAEVRQLGNGPESFTPDSMWLLGHSPKIKNYFIAAGMNGTGIVGAGGIGKNISDWIVDGDTDLNLWPYDVRRFVRLHNNSKFLRDRIGEAFSNIYQLKYPREEYTTGRKLRCSPLHTRLEVAGAVFGETMAYERAIYFNTPEQDETLGAVPGKMWSWSKPCWFEPVQEEYWACKERVCLIDMSSFSKLEVRSVGDEATAFLQRMCSNNITNEVGTIVHTGMQNHKGGFENDCTVACLDHNHYFIISPATQQTRAVAWLNAHLPRDGSVQVTDVTSMFSGINIIGPNAQQLLEDVSDIATHKTEFRPMSVKSVDVGHASGVLAMRLTHTGEDGFIVYIPSEYALHVYDTLIAAGKDYGIRNAGYYALRHLRIENFFAFWGPDLNDKTTPLECGRGFRTKLDRSEDFIGKDFLLKQRREGVSKRFTQFLLDDFDVHLDLWPWGGEPIYRDGKFVGMTSTCGYGFTLEKMVCLGFIGDIAEDGKWVTHNNINEWVMNRNSKYEIEVSGVRFSARPGIYTPKMGTKDQEPLFVPAPR